MVSKISDEEKKKWLKGKPETIVAYKAVVKYHEDGKYYPPFYSINNANGAYAPMREINTISEEPPMQETLDSIGSEKTSSYAPYFHFFTDKKAARVSFAMPNAVVRCEIPKKDITAIGEQNGAEVIVAKSFKMTKQLLFNRW